MSVTTTAAHHCITQCMMAGLMGLWRKEDILHCVRLLLDSGASAEAQNNRGSTPLHV
ncbi:hypothetical protein BJV77DRAFT_1052704, partial [Russula vinacea]